MVEDIDFKDVFGIIVIVFYLLDGFIIKFGLDDDVIMMNVCMIDSVIFGDMNMLVLKFEEKLIFGEFWYKVV